VAGRRDARAVGGHVDGRDAVGVAREREEELARRT
jgi:hypothetical protein